MKALSVKQPWASLIASGRKTIELRSWPTTYRGPIVVVASASTDRDAFARFGLESAPRGATVATTTFEDVGVSGAKGRRPGLDALLAAASKRRFDVLVVWRADRLFRSVHHMVTTLAELSAVGVDFVSCTEPFDTSTPTGRLLFHLCAVFAQFERDVIIERTVAGMAAARRRGKRIGRPRRYVDVERARELLAAGSSQRDVARELGVGLGTLQRGLAGDPEGSSPAGS